LQVFQRTANWVLPRLDRPYTALDRALVRLPLYARAVRAFWFQALEMGRRGFNEGSFMRRTMLGTAARHRQRQVADPGLRERLTPPYALGCKRLIYSNDYYPALAQPHVELVTDSITRVTSTGVVTVDSTGKPTERPLDVLVCATGFDVQHSLADVHISGRKGQTLDDAFADGPQAHLGLTVAGFPNLFLMLGPNTATGHTSTLLFIEPGARWAVKAMQEVAKRGVHSIEVQDSVMQAYNDHLQARLSGSVWASCRSWYRSDSGRVIAIFPGFTREYVKAVEQQPFADFLFV
jgi:cation diffusion facilitator CzcD-associated flavoprotein CzcO